MEPPLHRGLFCAASTPNLNEASRQAVDTHRSLADDSFRDADQYLAYTKSLGLLDSINVAKVATDLFLNNNFDLAEKKLRPLADSSMYHALGYGTIMFLKAMMTCDRGDMEKAMEASQNALTVIEKRRAHYSLTESLYRLGGQQKALNDEEVHAELCYAESLMFRAILTFFYDETLTSFIRGAFKVRACYQSYKECYRMLSTQSWKERDPRVRREFESGARVGMGSFGVALSILPGKLLKLLEVIGFSGDKLAGMRDLHLSAGMTDTLRGLMASMNLLIWQLFVTYFIGQGKPDVALCQRLLAPMKTAFPNGAILLFLRGRYYLVKCDLDNAIFFYNKSIESQSFYRQFHHICYWELQFAYACLRRWDRAANNAKLLKDESRWSRCVYTYLLAVYVNAEEGAEGRFETVSWLMQKIPQVRMRIAGKSIPVEKFCERKAKRFLAQGRLYFAHYEFLYFWNVFTILEARPEPYLGPILEDIEEFWHRHPSSDVNDVCMYEFLRGVCFKSLHSLGSAEFCFNKVIGSESALTDNFYLVPNACFELAMTCAADRRRAEAEALLRKARAYKGYSLENKLLFRVHSAMETLAGGAAADSAARP